MKYCKSCGTALEDSAKFCKQCGTPATVQPIVNNQQQTQSYQQSVQTPDYSDKWTYSVASGKNMHYVVLQVTLKEKFLGTGSGNLTALEECINAQAAKGYRLHTIATSSSGSTGMLGGDRIQATMVFERIV